MSVWVFTHADPHNVNPGAHPQVPELSHTWFAPHAVPAATGAQVPLAQVWQGPLQEAVPQHAPLTQFPLVQVAPVEQAAPFDDSDAHTPPLQLLLWQLALEVQALPSGRGAAQMPEVQTPLLHELPLVHDTPAPQLDEQEPPQSPPMQASPEAQAVPHPPQLAVSFVVSTQ